MRVLRGLPRFNGEYALQAWVKRIATNLCLDVLRARARHNGIDRAEEETGNAREELLDPSEVVDSLFRTQQVRAVLAGMSEPHRRVLVLRDLEGRSHHEIASTMGIPRSQVKDLIYGARRKFRQAWEGAGRRRFVVLPVAAFARVSDWVRDLLGPAREHAVVAAPVVAGASGLTDRLLAAAAAVAVAGSIGVGRVWAPRAPQAAPSVAAQTAAPARGPAPAPSAAVKRSGNPPAPADSPVSEQQPTDAPAPSPTDTLPVVSSLPNDLTQRVGDLLESGQLPPESDPLPMAAALLGTTPIPPESLPVALPSPSVSPSPQP